MKLADMQVGQSGRIQGFEPGDKHYRHRLIAMGLLPGTEFTVAHIAPLGDPVEITVRDYQLSLRKHEATSLQIEGVTHE